MTPYARELLRKFERSQHERSERLPSKYPAFKVVYCPRKSGVVWMCCVRRRNVSEHATKEEARAALEALKKGGAA